MNQLEDLLHCVESLNLGKQYGPMVGPAKGVWIGGDVAIHVWDNHHWIYIDGLPQGRITSIFDVQDFLIQYFDLCSTPTTK